MHLLCLQYTIKFITEKTEMLETRFCAYAYTAFKSLYICDFNKKDTYLYIKLLSLCKKGENIL